MVSSCVQHLLEVLPDFLIYISHFRGSCGSLFSQIGGHSQLWKGGGRLDLSYDISTSGIVLNIYPLLPIYMQCQAIVDKQALNEHSDAPGDFALWEREAFSFTMRKRFK